MRWRCCRPARGSGGPARSPAVPSNGHTTHPHAGPRAQVLKPTADQLIVSDGPCGELRIARGVGGAPRQDGSAGTRGGAACWRGISWPSSGVSGQPRALPWQPSCSKLSHHCSWLGRGIWGMGLTGSSSLGRPSSLGPCPHQAWAPPGPPWPPLAPTGPRRPLVAPLVSAGPRWPPSTCHTYAGALSKAPAPRRAPAPYAPSLN